MRLRIKYFAAVLMFAAASHPSKAKSLSITDLLRRWCGIESTYVFSRTELTVRRLDGTTPKHGTVLRIADVKADDQEISVHWFPEKPGNSTGFPFSSNKRVLIRQPNTTGDKGPRREFHRC